jgi:5-methyltetrahydrofolate--homocysteine methyltransferase
VTEAKKKKPEVVAISTLLTTTMPGMQSTIEAIKKAKIKVKTLVGGAPVSKDFAEQIGATAYGADALEAVKICKSWIAS